MAYTSIKAGTASYTIQFVVQDSSSTTGGLLSGLVYNTAGLTAYYKRDTDNAPTQITLVNKPDQNYVSGGFRPCGTGMSGCYELALPNAAVAAGAKNLVVLLSGAANMAPLPMLIELTQTDNQDANAGGMYLISNASYQADYIAEWFNGASGTLYDDVQSMINIGNTLRILSTNKTIADPITHTQKVYNDAGDAVFVSALIYEDPEAQIPYRGQGISRREKFQ